MQKNMCFNYKFLINIIFLYYSANDSIYMCETEMSVIPLSKEKKNKINQWKSPNSFFFRTMEFRKYYVYLFIRLFILYGRYFYVERYAYVFYVYVFNMTNEQRKKKL